MTGATTIDEAGQPGSPGASLVDQRVRLGAEAPTLPEPVGFRTRYRSEPGMIGHYPWTYADQSRRRVDRREHEAEDLYTADQMRAAVAAERERWTLLLTEKWHSGDGKGQTLAQYMGMTDGEYAAWVLRA